MAAKQFIRPHVLMICLSVGCLPAAFAAPPTDVTVNYDAKNSALSVRAQHPTDRPERYYVRTMEIYKNGVKDKTITFPRQTYAWGIEETVEYPAQPGDHLNVVLFASEGGSGSAETVVTEIEKSAAPAESPVPSP